MCYMPVVSKRGWVSLGMCLFGAACAPDERAVDTTQGGGTSGDLSGPGLRLTTRSHTSGL